MMRVLAMLPVPPTRQASPQPTPLMRFCRPIETDKIPAGGTTGIWTKKYGYPVLMPLLPRAAVNYTDVIVNDGVGGFTNRTYIDGFGRTLQTRIQGENGNFRVISTAYDGRGKAFLTTWPVFVNGAGFTKPAIIRWPCGRV